MSLEKFLNSRLAKTLRDLASTARAVMFFGGAALVGLGLAYAAVAYLDLDSVVIAGTVAGIAVATLGQASTWYYVTHSYEPPYYEILDIEGSLTIESLDGHHRYKYVKRQTVRTLRNDLRLIEFRAHWTGQGSTMQVEPLVSGHVLLDSIAAEEDGRVHRWIYPGGPVGKGQVLDAGIQQVHEDDIVRQKPYYRDGGGQYKTRKLTIITRFPIHDEPHPVEGVVWNSNLPVGQNKMVGNIGYAREIDRVAGTVNYIVSVDRPKRYHSYGVKWRWDSNNSI